MNKIIVSLTTFPERIDTIGKVIESLIKQTVPCDKILLYLAKVQFPGEKLNVNLEKYKKSGLEIRWCDEDLRSFKKFYYAMQEYPNDLIITVDDDFCYKETMIEELVKYHEKYSKAVIARRAYLIVREDNGDIAPYTEWYFQYNNFVGIPRMDMFATTGGGTLFPPQVFNKEIFNKEVFTKYCTYADDVWIKVMQLLSNIPTVLVNKTFDEIIIKEYENNGLFVNYNYGNVNSENFSKLLKMYESGQQKENFLIDRLFADGVYMSDIIEETQKNIYKFFENIKNDSILIYGAGVVAKRLYRIIRRLNIKKNIIAFVVKNKEENVKTLYGLPVFEYSQYIQSNNVFLIGLSSARQEEVVFELKENGIAEERILKISDDINKAVRYLDTRGDLA